MPGESGRPFPGEDVCGHLLGDFIALVAGGDANANNAAVAFAARGADFEDFRIDSQRVAGPGGDWPAKFFNAGTDKPSVQLKFPGDKQLHGNSRRMPAAGAEFAKETVGGRYWIGVKGLRVVLPGERDDVCLSQGMTSRRVPGTGPEVFDVEHFWDFGAEIFD